MLLRDRGWPAATRRKGRREGINGALIVRNGSFRKNSQCEYQIKRFNINLCDLKALNGISPDCVRRYGLVMLMTAY